MIRVLPNGEGIAGVWRKRHLQCSLVLIPDSCVKNRPYVLGAAVSREIQLDRHSFPVRVRMNADAITRHIPSQDRNRIHADLAVGRAKPILQAGGELTPERL